MVADFRGIAGQERHEPTDGFLVKLSTQAPRTDTNSHRDGLIFWIPIPEAERRFEVTRSELIQRVQTGGLTARRILCGDDLVIAVSSSELEATYRPRPASEFATGGPFTDERESAQTIAELKAQLEDERQRRADLEDEQRRELESERLKTARLEGELGASSKVERSLQAYADRLEDELVSARKQAMTLARALGRAEQLAEAAPARLAAKAAPKRRFWPFGR